MSLKGLTEHIGTYPSRFHLYIAKEELDNGCDYIENTYTNAEDMRVIYVFIKSDQENLTFTIRNSNPGNRRTTFQTHIKDIFNYDYFLSTKKNKFAIGRGAIGDANKPILSIPYALLLENGSCNGMDPPLSIQYNNKESVLSLDTDKFLTSKILPIIETKDKPVPNTYTQVQIKLPIGRLECTAVDDLIAYCLNYSIFSTHIRFYFDFNGQKFVINNDAASSSTWKNPITAWAYDENEFLIYLDNLADLYPTKPISNILKSFRELTWLPKEWHSQILGELSNNDRKNLLASLKSHSKPLEKLSLPFGGIKQKDMMREYALRERISRIYPVDSTMAKYKIVRTRYESKDGTINFPYTFEVIAIPFRDINSNYRIFIGSVNNSVSIINNGASLYDGTYRFKDKDDQIVWNMSGLLDRWYGGHLSESKKSWPCVIAANLLTPKVYWREQGKSTHHIEFFADTISNTFTKVMKKIPTFHGMSDNSSSSSSSNGKVKKDAIEYLVEFLRERKKAVEANTNIIETDRITQSSVWYRIRPEMMKDYDKGIFKPNKSWSKTRRYLTGIIDGLCKGETLFRGDKIFGEESLSREDLGIFAIAKGMMIYRGESYPISIDNIKKIANKGIAVWPIEKEGIPNIIAPFAGDYAIALIATGGRFSKYIKRLIEEIKKIGSVVQIVVDFDAVGDDIARSTYTPTVKIGLERVIVPWLQNHGYPNLTEEDVEEKYTPRGVKVIHDEYLKHKRIELDSIVAKTSGGALFKYLLYKAQQKKNAPNGFNVAKVIRIPDDDEFYSNRVNAILSRYEYAKNTIVEKLKERIRVLLEKKKEEIKTENQTARKLDTIEKMNLRFKNDLKALLADDEIIKTESKQVIDFITRLIGIIKNEIGEVAEADPIEETPEEFTDSNGQNQENKNDEIEDDSDNAEIEEQSQNDNEIYDEINEEEEVGFDSEHRLYDESCNLLGPEDDERYNLEPAFDTHITPDKPPKLQDPFFIPVDDDRPISEIVSDILFKPLDNIDLPLKQKALKQELQANLKAGDEFIQRIPVDERVQAKRQILKILFSKMLKRRRRKSPTNLHVDSNDKIDKKWLGVNPDA